MVGLAQRSDRPELTESRDRHSLCDIAGIAAEHWRARLAVRFKPPICNDLKSELGMAGIAFLGSGNE
jgi:hypothetical protein